jgi:hypothetical protein
MQVQIIHEDSHGAKTDFGTRELTHMPPVAEPFPVDRNTYYMTKAYFGPNEEGVYLLVLEGPPKLLE